MARRTLPDGTIIASGFAAPQKRSRTFHDYALRTGYVTEVLPPSHENNRSGSVHEYNVVAYYYDDRENVRVPTTYYNCRVASLFGNQGEKVSYTLRAGNEEPGSAGELGSFVFLLCENGNPYHAYIIGAPSHPADASPIDEHHFLFRFNGVELFIDGKGVVSLLRKGPVDAFGEPTADVTNTLLSILEDGSIFLEDGRGQEVMLGKDFLSLLSAGKVRVNAQEIVFGSESVAPLVRATDEHVRSLKNLNSTLKSVSADLKALCAGIAAEPTLSASKAPAGKLQATLALLDLAVDQYDATLEPGKAISEKTFTE